MRHDVDGSALDLRALLREVTDRVENVALVADRLQDLFHAVVSISSHLDLDGVLLRVVETAAELAGAEYAALGVVDPAGDERLSQFVTTGISPDAAARIGHLPQGRGVLGLLIREPRPIRLTDLTSHPASAGFPSEHPPMHAFLGVPISVGGDVFGNLYLTEKRGGGAFTDDDEQVVLTLASAAGLAVQNARLYEQSRRRQQWLEAGTAITTQLLSGTPAHEVLPEVVRQARDLGDAELALVALTNPDGTLTVVAADGEGADAVLRRDLPSESLTAAVMADGIPVAIGDVHGDSRVWPGLLGDLGVGPGLFVPLGARGQAVGTLVVTRTTGGRSFADDELRVIESFAAQAALALRLGSAAADREQLAVLGDRDRIARDLHDLVIQRLFAVGLSLEGATRSASPDLADRLRAAVDDLDTTIKEIRTAVFALQAPAPAAGEGVRAAVLHAATASARMLGFEPSVVFEGPVDLLVDARPGEQLLAVLREALANVARHAGATRVSVVVAADVDRVALMVSDDGRGIQGEPRGGLLNLARRAEDLGGTFEVGRGAVGTVLRWSAPTR
jgi:signal transduction histidine kinase